MIEVNAGPLAIGDTFITIDYPSEGRNQIITLLQRLAKVLRSAVELNAKLVNESQLKFQAALEKGSDKFDEKVAFLIRMSFTSFLHCITPTESILTYIADLNQKIENESNNLAKGTFSIRRRLGSVMLVEDAFVALEDSSEVTTAATATTISSTTKTVADTSASNSNSPTRDRLLRNRPHLIKPPPKTLVATAKKHKNAGVGGGVGGVGVGGEGASDIVTTSSPSVAATTALFEEVFTRATSSGISSRNRWVSTRIKDPAIISALATVLTETSSTHPSTSATPPLPITQSPMSPYKPGSSTTVTAPTHHQHRHHHNSISGGGGTGLHYYEGHQAPPPLPSSLSSPAPSPPPSFSPPLPMSLSPAHPPPSLSLPSTPSSPPPPPPPSHVLSYMPSLSVRQKSKKPRTALQEIFEGEDKDQDAATSRLRNKNVATKSVPSARTKRKKNDAAAAAGGGIKKDKV